VTVLPLPQLSERMPKHRSLRAIPGAFILLALAASAAVAQGDRAVIQKLDSTAASGVLENRAVGIVAAVVKGNDTLLLKGYGKADVEWDVPMPADAVFEIGSVTKQFTAAAILQLRDAGKLSLDDEITKWLPDFDTRGNKVPLRRLMDHTSGIVGITEMPEFGILVQNARFPRDSGYALIRKYPFQFPTGTAQVYNNSAFWLLGLVVEKASGMTYEDYVEKKMFEPLGMTRSMYCSSAEHVPRRAHGYGVQNGVVRRAPTNVHTWPFSAGSLCSTAGDMVTWLKALHGGKVLSPKSYAEMIRPSSLNDGTPLRYGMGIGVGKDIRGLNFIGHGGSIAGFVAEANWYPDAQMAVVVLMNANSNLDPSAVASELAAEVLPWTRPTMRAFAGDAAALVGTYKGPSRGRDMVVQVTQTPQGVAFSANGSPARPLPWVDGLTFRQGSAFLTFRRADGDGGPVTELRFDAGSGYYILKRQ
jgi:CubicO group peptidase (beta-lactamase class C family)